MLYRPQEMAFGMNRRKLSDDNVRASIDIVI